MRIFRVLKYFFFAPLAIPDLIPHLQARLATLEQQNARLRSQLNACQQSHQALQKRVTELEIIRTDIG